MVICPALLAEVEDVLGHPRNQKRVKPELAGLYLATVQRIADLVAEQRPPVITPRAFEHLLGE